MLCYVKGHAGILLVEAYKRGGKGTKRANRHILWLGNGLEDILV